MTAKNNSALQKQPKGWVRFVVVDANYPRPLWLVWDRTANDNLRGEALGGRRFPWFTTEASAQKVANKCNARTA